MNLGCLPNSCYYENEEFSRHRILIVLLAVPVVLIASPADGDDEKEELIAFLKEIDALADDEGNAHWLIGAQHLALKQPTMAIEQFEQAVQQFAVAKKPDYQHMAEGYTGITQLTQAVTRNQGRKKLDKAIADRRSRSSQDKRRKVFRKSVEVG